MTLIIEDGTLPEGADSYASVEDADSYLVPRGLWAATLMLDGEEEEDDPYPSPATVAAKESALLRACDFLNSLDWRGYSVDWQRVMAWPRSECPHPGGASGVVIPDNVIPQAVKRAQIELAALIYAGTDPLAPIARGGRVVAESHSVNEGNVDVIGGDSTSDSYTYAESAPVEAYFPAVVNIIEPLLNVVPGKAKSARMVTVDRA